MKTFLFSALMVTVLAGWLATPTFAGVWGLWNDPPATRPVIKSHKDQGKEQLQTARERAKEKKRLALEAMRRLERARRAAKQAEREQLAEETSYSNHQEYELLQRRAAREQAAAQSAPALRAVPLPRSRIRSWPVTWNWS